MSCPVTFLRDCFRLRKYPKSLKMRNNTQLAKSSRLKPLRVVLIDQSVLKE